MLITHMLRIKRQLYQFQNKLLRNDVYKIGIRTNLLVVRAFVTEALNKSTINDIGM